MVPVNAADLTSFAQLCLHALDIDAATGALAQAERLEPEYPELLATRALLSMYMGRFAEAETDCVRCLALDTSNASAAVTLSRVRRGRLADSELAIMRRVADDANAHLDRRIPAAFTIAHALIRGATTTRRLRPIRRRTRWRNSATAWNRGASTRAILPVGVPGSWHSTSPARRLRPMPHPRRAPFL